MAAITVDAATRIDAPPQTVWAFACDPERYPEWSVVTERMTHIEDNPIDDGTEYSEIGGVGPMTGESDWVVTSFEPPSRQVHEGHDGTVRTVLTIEMESVDGGESTRLHQTLELYFPRGLRLIARLLGWLFLHRMAENIMDETVQNAKRIVESERTALEQTPQTSTST